MSLPLLALLAALAASPGDDATARARAEIERQLETQRAAVPGPEAAILFAPAAGEAYVLEEASLSLDGKALSLPALEKLQGAAAAELVFAGPVAAGAHELVVRLAYKGDVGPLYLRGYKFKLLRRVSFEAQRGLRLAVAISVRADESAELSRRLSIDVQRSGALLSPVDTTVPEPFARPASPAAEAAPETAPGPKRRKVRRAKPPRVLPAVAVADPQPEPEPEEEIAEEAPPEPEVAAAEEVPAPVPAPAPPPPAAPPAAAPPVAAPPTPARDPLMLVVAGFALAVAAGSFGLWVRASRRPVSRSPGRPSRRS